ncbi:pyridoxamine 5'-phosphate oxidase family protein [Mycolicibacterium obuense]|uniref:Pyridoxamine 5'-phosphate oxidase n=1 Tax=Mycolicibacterium obuense TaxID=1807 RepID=A0A0J6W3Y2_9MYCO|nr:pyridoxamine 5'-phosphate oxidase family protein [Mycolicibacterium obuense]KMO76367.1 Pyridoxamine 5'-phosphate oxidase [Mycolicibacterium obuense]TDL11760.1 pyridoxamine 5'-phosphate oxidase family protein [Mycolicibacterium obuense]
MNQLTENDLQLLSRPLYGFLTTAEGSLPPQPRPVWFEVTEAGDIQLFSAPDTARVRRLHRNPRASLVVTAPVGEREQWVSVTGTATIATDGAHAVLERLAPRYWDLDDPRRAGDLAAMSREQWVRIVIHPQTVHRYAM